jgi:hypothetical protein
MQLRRYSSLFKKGTATPIHRFYREHLFVEGVKNTTEPLRETLQTDWKKPTV